RTGGPRTGTRLAAGEPGASAGDGSGGRHARPHADPDHGVGSPERGGVRSGARTGARRPGREIRRRGTAALPRTGPASDRLLLLLAGTALALGGLSILGAAGRRGRFSAV